MRNNPEFIGVNGVRKVDKKSEWSSNDDNKD